MDCNRNNLMNSQTQFILVVRCLYNGKGYKTYVL